MAHRQSNATHTFHDILEAAHLDLSTPSCYSEQLFKNFIFILLFFFLPPTKLCLIYFHISIHPQPRSLSMLVVKLLTWIWMLLWSLCFSLLCLQGARSQWRKGKQCVNPRGGDLKDQTPSESIFIPGRWLLDASVRTDPALLCFFSQYWDGFCHPHPSPAGNEDAQFPLENQLQTLPGSSAAHSMALMDQIDEYWNALIK